MTLPAAMHQEIERRLRADALGRPLRLLEVTGSTNDDARAWALEGASEGATVMALSQTRGRGRAGRVWQSPAGLGLYLSVVLRPAWPPAELGVLAILGGLAVAQALDRLGATQIRIKHPNDVLARGRKIAGVLVEPRIGGTSTEFAIAGIGVNLLHQREDFKTLGLNGTATSCRLERIETTADIFAPVLLHELTDLYRMADTPDGRSRLKVWWLERGGGDGLPEVH